MGKPALTLSFSEEAAFGTAAGVLAKVWAEARGGPLVIGLSGDLGSGKTTWVRAMLRGLGHRGRVPSPTYTLLEEYGLGALTVVHLDLYRLREAAELEHLGLRDWLARADVWLLVEWPERSPPVLRACDVVIRFDIIAETARRVALCAQTPAGQAALERVLESSSNYTC